MLIMFNNFKDDTAKGLTNLSMFRPWVFYLFNIHQSGP